MRKIIIVVLMTAVFLSPTVVFAVKEKIVIGSKTFTEQHLLGHILVRLLRANDYEVEERININTRHLRPALLEGKIDIYWEYTGTAYRGFFKRNNPIVASNSSKLFETVKQLDYQKNKVLWLNRANLNNTWVLVMTSKFAQNKPELNKMTELSKVFKKYHITFGVSEDFYHRPDGFKKLQKYYQFQIPRAQIQILEHKAIIGALSRGQVHIGMRYATDPEIKVQNLVVVEDDRSFFPVYNPAPVILEKTAKKYPRIVELANQLGPLLDNQAMIDLNHQVDIEKKAIEEVVRNWLKKVHLLP